MKKIYVFLFLVALIKVAADAQVIYIDNSGVQASYDSTLFVKHSDAEIKYKIHLTSCRVDFYIKN